MVVSVGSCGGRGRPRRWHGSGPETTEILRYAPDDKRGEMAKDCSLLLRSLSLDLPQPWNDGVAADVAALCGVCPSPFNVFIGCQGRVLNSGVNDSR